MRAVVLGLMVLISTLSFAQSEKIELEEPSSPVESPRRKVLPTVYRDTFQRGNDDPHEGNYETAIMNFEIVTLPRGKSVDVWLRLRPTLERTPGFDWPRTVPGYGSSIQYINRQQLRSPEHNYEAAILKRKLLIDGAKSLIESIEKRRGPGIPLPHLEANLKAAKDKLSQLEESPEPQREDYENATQVRFRQPNNTRYAPFSLQSQRDVRQGGRVFQVSEFLSSHFIGSYTFNDRDDLLYGCANITQGSTMRRVNHSVEFTLFIRKGEVFQGLTTPVEKCGGTVRLLDTPKWKFMRSYVHLPDGTVNIQPRDDFAKTLLPTRRP